MPPFVIPFRSCNSLDTKRIRSYVKKEFGREVADQYRQKLQSLVDARSCASQVRSSEDFETLFDYLVDVEFISPKFGWASPDLSVTFSWSDAFSPKTRSTSVFPLIDRLALFWNMASIKAHEASSLLTSSPDQARLAVSQYCDAAGLISACQELIESGQVDKSGLGLDLSLECLEGCRRMYLGAAHGCHIIASSTLSKLEQAKLHAVAAGHFISAFKSLSSGQLGKSISAGSKGFFGSIIASYAMHAAQSEQILGDLMKERNAWGQCVARYTRAVQALDRPAAEGIQLDKHGACDQRLQAEYAALATRIRAEFADVTKKNNTIFIEQVPPPETLKAANAVGSVNCLEATPLDQLGIPTIEGREDPWMGLVSTGTTLAQSMISQAVEQRRKTLKDAAIKLIRDTVSELRCLGLPHAISAADPSVIVPPGLLSDDTFSGILSANVGQPTTTTGGKIPEYDPYSQASGPICQPTAPYPPQPQKPIQGDDMAKVMSISSNGDFASTLSLLSEVQRSLEQQMVRAQEAISRGNVLEQAGTALSAGNTQHCTGADIVQSLRSAADGLNVQIQRIMKSLNAVKCLVETTSSMERQLPTLTITTGSDISASSKHSTAEALVEALIALQQQLLAHVASADTAFVDTETEQRAIVDEIRESKCDEATAKDRVDQFVKRIDQQMTMYCSNSDISDLIGRVRQLAGELIGVPGQSGAYQPHRAFLEHFAVANSEAMGLKSEASSIEMSLDTLITELNRAEELIEINRNAASSQNVSVQASSTSNQAESQQCQPTPPVPPVSSPPPPPPPPPPPQVPQQFSQVTPESIQQQQVNTPQFQTQPPSQPMWVPPGQPAPPVFAPVGQYPQGVPPNGYGAPGVPQGFSAPPPQQYWQYGAPPMQYQYPQQPFYPPQNYQYGYPPPQNQQQMWQGYPNQQPPPGGYYYR